MVEYIEKEAAQKIICGWCGVCKSPTVCDLMHCDDICPQFAQIPAADVRLIDADAFVRSIRNAIHYDASRGREYISAEDLHEALTNAPTIIPAEEG